MIFTTHTLFRTFLKVSVCQKSIRYLHDVKRSILNRDVGVAFLDGPQTGIAVMTLYKPQTKNALDNRLVDNFLSVMEDVQNDDRTKVVVLRSLIPLVFCAGANLKERLQMSDKEVQRFISKLHRLTINLANLCVPVIAAIDGIALGGGLEIALACDMRVASESAQLGLVETKLAIIPGAGGTQRLPRLVGPAVAKELIFTGRIITGLEAHKLGVVNHAVPQNRNNDAAYVKAIEIAEEILPTGPEGVRMAKVAVNHGLEVDIDTGYIIEENCYGRLIPTKDRIEGLLAFSEKRKPVYKGE